MDRLTVRALLALVAGGAAATGFVPLGFWPVTVAMIAVLGWLVLRATTLGGALLTGWLFGLGHFTIGNNWIAGAFRHQDAMPAWLGWFAVPVLALYLAVYPAIAAGLAWRWGRAGGLRFALLFAAAWIVTEWLRATMFTGFAWNPLAAAWVDTPARLLLPWTGTYALSGLLVLLGGCAMLAARLDRASALPIAAVAVSAALLQAWPLPSAVPAMGPQIRVVQPNIGLNENRDIAVARDGLERLARLSTDDAVEARLVFWPEAALNDIYQIEHDARLRSELATLLRPGDLLVTGGTRIEFARERVEGGIAEVATGATNSVFVLDAGGRIGARYDKAHLVPYGEYLPMRPLLTPLGLARLVPGDLDFRPGPGPRSLPLPGFGTAGIQVCYEIIFSGQVVDRANRPDFIFNPSIDTWFGDWGPPQHLAQARLRAAEEGLPVVRATPTGISAVIDAHGRELVSLPQGKAGVIATRLPAPLPPPLFARHGNVLAFALALLLAGIAIALPRHRS